MKHDGTIRASGCADSRAHSELAAGTGFGVLRHDCGCGSSFAPATGSKEVTAVAPISGRLVKLFPHAFMITSGEQTVLVHLGIDTVKMRGDGFTCHALENAMVKAGEPITTFSVKRIEKARYSPLCPVVVLDSTPSDLENLRPEGNQVEVGDLLFEISAAPAGDPNEW